MTRIEINNVSVDFTVYDSNSRRLLHPSNLLPKFRIGGAIRENAQGKFVVSALRDVSLTLNQGDQLGLIGHNGAGKSTLLRSIAGIYTPIKGNIVVEGKLSTLFNPGLGMDLEATGKENLRMMALIRGFTRQQINSMMPEMEKFTELGAFLDLPARTYSSGMVARLGFSVATALEPEILVIDEAIGAGDEDFMRKAKARINGFIVKSNILVLASHSMELLKHFCNIGAVLEHGELKFIGPIEEAEKWYTSQPPT